MPLALARQQAIAALNRPLGHAVKPRMMADGRGCIAEAASTDAGLSVVVSGAEVVSSPTWDGSTGWFHVNGHPVTVNSARADYSLSEVATDVFRFEVKCNDAGTSTDLKNGNRRCEIVSLAENGFSSGQTIWYSCSLIRGPSPGLMLTDTNIRFGYCFQIHSGVSGWPPVFVIDISRGELKFRSQSDEAFNSFVTHYTQAIPEEGAVTNIVVAVTLGQSGRVVAYVNGALVVDQNTPVGFWTTGGVLGHPQFGLYTKNWNTSDVVYIANPEWGESSLFARVATPIAVPNLSPWA